MADAQNPTGHVAFEADLYSIQNPAEGDVYVTDDTAAAWVWRANVWVRVANAPPEVVPEAAPAPGTAVAGTTTIDALFTTMFATRSGDLGAATYRWSDERTIQAIFAAGTTPTAVNGSMMTCKFECRAFSPSSIAP